MKNILFIGVLFFLFNLSNTLFGQNIGLNYDGTDDYIQTTYSGISGSSARTVEAWIKTTAVSDPNFGGTQKVIADWGSNMTGQRFTFCMLWDNAIRIEIGGSGLSGTITVNDGLWHHVAVVYDPLAIDKYSLYVDGVLDISGNLMGTINTGSTVDLRIGIRVDGTKSFEGDIDEVRIFNYARTMAEISAQMSAEFCIIPASLVAYYRLNNGVASAVNTGLITAVDESVSGNDGTLLHFNLMGANSNWVTGASLTIGATTSSITVNTCNDYTAPSGAIFTSTGHYSDIIPNSAGCDSLISINLTISPITNSISATSCSSYLSPSGNDLWTTSGIYIDTVQTLAGCDSIITVNLTLNSYDTTILVSDCDTYTTPSGANTWTSTGVYSEVYFNVAGCDSVIFYDLTIHGVSTATISEFACGDYTSPSGDSTWSISGTYTDLMTSVNGCDSIITINLTIINVNNSVSITGATLTANLINATYQWYICDSSGLVIIPGEINQSYTAIDTGTYAVEVTVNGCTTASDCYSINKVSLHKNEPELFQIYPNPNQGEFIIEVNDLNNAKLNIYNVFGQLVFTSFLNEKSTLIDVKTVLPKAVYIVSLKTDEESIPFKLIIK